MANVVAIMDETPATLRVFDGRRVTGCPDAIVDATSHEVIPAASVAPSQAATGLKLHISRVSLSNSHAVTGTIVELYDGATLIWQGFIPALGHTEIENVRDAEWRLGGALNAKALTAGANVLVAATGFYGK